MALDAKEAKKIKLQLSQVPQVNTLSPSSTDYRQMKEQTRKWLAIGIAAGLFLMLFLLSILLFILLLLNNQNAGLFKDILLSFIGFASGLLVSIFGFYFKGIKDEES
ncbi:MAG: hypothetical protein HY344_03545 [Candidatus Levybacteria bacterium]|nr:hypothetical protein [Candidatus Levybacteria bacterium]